MRPRQDGGRVRDSQPPERGQHQEDGHAQQGQGKKADRGHGWLVAAFVEGYRRESRFSGANCRVLNVRDGNCRGTLRCGGGKCVRPA